MNTSKRIKDGLIAGSTHLLISGIIALIVYLLLRKIWFVAPWDDLLGGSDLLLMMILVDVVCGPLLTALVVHSAKVRWKNILDISVIALLQLGVLMYGVWTAWLAKPSWLVFETDRFVLVRQADVYEASPATRAHTHPVAFADLQLKGVSQLSGQSGDEVLGSLNLSLQGIPPAFRPQRWVEYDDVKPQLLKVAHSLPILLKATGISTPTLFWSSALRDSPPHLDTLKYVPLQVKDRTDWVVLLDPTTLRPVGYAPLDPWQTTKALQ